MQISFWQAGYEWEDNIKTDLKNMMWKGTLHLAGS
jgi:hypothetical protein